MAKTADIKAGGAFIELYVKGQNLVKTQLDGVGATYRRFSAAVSAQAKIAQKTIVACNRAIARSAALTGRGMAGVSKLGHAANAAGRTALIGGGAGALAMGVSAATYMGFEKEMSKVRALTQASGEEYEKLVALAKELGATTEYTAQNAAEGMSFLGMTGYKTNQILAATPVLLDAATAAGMDLGRTADIMSDIGQAFGISADDIERVADVLSVTAMNANTNVEMMGTSFQYVAASAKVAGQPIEEVAAALGIMANSGIKASKAGTGLRAMLAVVGSRLGKKKLFREFGISAWDAQGNIKPLLTIIQELDKAMQGLATGQKAAKLNLVFGKIAGNAVGTLVNNAKSVDKYRDLTNNQRDGATKKMAATMRDNLWGSWKGLVSAVEAVQIAIGEAITGELRGFLDTVTTISRALAKWVKENKQVIVTAGKVAVAVAGIGAGVVTVGTLIGGVGAIVTPLIGAIASFGAVGLGVFGAIASAAAATIGVVGTLVGGFVSAGVAVGGFLVTLGPVGMILAAIAGDVMLNLHSLGAFKRGITGIAGSIAGCFRGLGESIWVAVGDIGRAFARIFIDAKKLVSELAVTFSRIWDALKSGDMNLAMDIAWTEIELRFEQGKQYLIGVFEEFSEIAQKLLAGIQQAFTDMLNGLKDSMYEFLNSLNISKNKTLYANIFPDINFDALRKDYGERKNKSRVKHDSIQAKKDAIREALYQKPEGLDDYETGVVQKFDSLEQAGLASLGGHSIGHIQLYKRQSNGTKVWATQEEQKEHENLIAASKLQREQINESISRVYEQKGEAGLDELLRQNGVDPEKFTNAKATKAESQSALPSPQNIASQKRIADLQAKRENLLKQAPKEAEKKQFEYTLPEIKQLEMAPVRSYEMTPTQQSRYEKQEQRRAFYDAKKERQAKKREEYQARREARTVLRARTNLANTMRGLVPPEIMKTFFADESKSFSESQKALAEKAYGKTKSFSERAMQSMPRASVFDMTSGGGTFSGYEMGNLGGNTLAKMMGDSLSVQRNMDNKLGLMLEEMAEGGYGD